MAVAIYQSNEVGRRASSGHGRGGEGGGGEGPERAPHGALHVNDGGVAARCVGAGARGGGGRGGVARARVEARVREVLRREGPRGEVRLQELVNGRTPRLHPPIPHNHM